MLPLINICIPFVLVLSQHYIISLAKFVPLADNETPKLRGGSFGEHSLSVNDVLPEVEMDLLDRGNMDDSAPNSAQRSGEGTTTKVEPHSAPQVIIASKVHEKMLYSQLNALKDSKYPLSMEAYFFSWINFKQQHGKKYGSFHEEKNRFQIYVDNHEYVRLHNLAHDLGLKSFSVALNKYSDMTTEEFIKTMNGFKRSLADSANQNRTKFMAPLNFRAPDKVDWRQEGYVTPIKSQGHCGSCWAFSATGALEGQHKRKFGTLVSLSEQNLLDCSFKFGNEGCNGGLMDNAFQYIKQNHGVDTENSYPYEAKEGKCRFKKSTIGADDDGFVDLEEGNETGLALAIASQGPISVAIDAGHRSFQMYNKGVYFEPNCSSTELDHGVLAIGYATTEDGKDYWLIKNSWGLAWGEEGYMKMTRNRDNHCGVATQASYPVV